MSKIKKQGNLQMIILVCGEKGGTGKTTIATNLAAMRAIDAGEDNVLLADADPQKSSSLWCSIRNPNEAIKTKITSVQKSGDISQDIKSLSKKFQDIIIDAGGYDSMELRSGMLVADILITPVSAGQFDMWTMPKMNGHIQKSKLFNPELKSFCLLNQASALPKLKKNEIDDILNYLEDFPELPLMDTVVVRRQSYRKAAIEGLCVSEWVQSNKLAGMSDKSADNEIKQLYTEIFINKE